MQILDATVKNKKMVAVINRDKNSIYMEDGQGNIYVISENNKINTSVYSSLTEVLSEVLQSAPIYEGDELKICF